MNNRPFAVCHILSTVDGKISGAFMGASEIAGARKAYGDLRDFYHCDALLYGTATMAESYGCVKNLPTAKEKYPREDFINHGNHRDFIVSIDTEGVLRFSGNTLTRSGKENAHVIEVLTERVSDEYLHYLRGLGISYIFAGKTALDFSHVMEKLKEKFGIERVMIAGGGKIDQAFLEAGVLDELSLVIAPMSSGDKNAVAVFERIDNSAPSPVALRLEEVKPIDGNGVWLRYTTIR